MARVKILGISKDTVINVGVFVILAIFLWIMKTFFPD